MNWVREKWVFPAIALVTAAIILSTLFGSYSGPDVIPEPTQVNLESAVSKIYEGEQGPVPIRFLAEYEIVAAVKSKKSYHTDYPAQVSPVDLVLAWGRLNQKEIDKHIRYTQSNRWYYFQFSAESPVGATEIQHNSANVHIIPENRRIAGQIRRLRKNDTVRLEGYLAAVDFLDGAWISSLSREDSGDGACEILFVTSVTILR